MKSKQLWLLCICAGRWQLNGMLQAKKQGYKLFAVDGDKNAEGLKIADKFLVIDIHETKKIINYIKDQKIGLGGVICLTSDIGQKTASIIREEFKLFGMSYKISKRMTNKEIQRGALTNKKGIDIPKWLIIEKYLNSNKIIEDIGLPCVVKPVDSAGSRGVEIVYEEQDLEEKIRSASLFSSNSRVIVEEYIQGVEYTVETFTHKLATHLLLITEKSKLNKTLANELFSSELEEKDVIELTTKIEKIFKTLEYKYGAGHTEFIKRNSDGVFFLVESAGRGGGFLVADLLVPEASGFNLNEACVVQAMGDEPNKFLNTRNNKTLLRFIPSQDGVIQGISGFEAANKINNVVAGCFVKIGDKTKKAQSDGDRIGYILTKGKTKLSALLLANKIEEKIKINYVKN
ncbi:ATP-grasp domain-containing protein [bacterium]|jgi:biotin carboxylase|nr:ATP-grasp domain-containing protein [bacterium]